LIFIEERARSFQVVRESGCIVLEEFLVLSVKVPSQTANNNISVSVDQQPRFKAEFLYINGGMYHDVIVTAFPLPSKKLATGFGIDVDNHLTSGKYHRLLLVLQ
jgi:hypothetical protein